jgi:hypothetical protein
VQVLLVLVQALALKQAQLVRVQRARQLQVQRELVQLEQKLFVQLSELVEFHPLVKMWLQM